MLTDSLIPINRERYRKQRGWGALSVSDLSGPSWCEVTAAVQRPLSFTTRADRTLAQVQHTYRLASKPFLPPLERPATITTAAGAVIQVDATRTVKRESILDRGKEVHRRIEKQVMGDVEEVKVNVTGKEEWWALRILNTIICLHTLLENGKVVRFLPCTAHPFRALTPTCPSTARTPRRGLARRPSRLWCDRRSRAARGRGACSDR